MDKNVAILQINNVINAIDKRISNCEISCIYVGGSAQLVNNPRDVDLIVGFKNSDYLSYMFHLDRLDVKCQNLSVLYNQMTGEKPLGVSAYLGKNNLIYGKFPFEDLEWREQKEKVLRAEYNHMMNDFETFIKDGKCHKHLVWKFAAYFAYLNDQLEFTSLQKEIIQKCHDQELSTNYIENLKIDMESILKIK